MLVPKLKFFLIGALKTTVEKQKQSEFENLMGDDMKGLVSSVQVFGNNEYSV